MSVADGIPWKVVKSVFMQRVSTLRLRRLFRAVLGRDDVPESPDEVLGPGPLLLLFTASLLTSKMAASEVSTEAQDLALEELGKELVAYGQILGEVFRSPPVFLTFYDGVFVRLTNNADKRLLDLRTGKRRETLPLPAIDVRAFDLNAIYTRCLALCKEHASRSAAASATKKGP